MRGKENGQMCLKGIVQGAWSITLKMGGRYGSIIVNCSRVVVDP